MHGRFIALLPEAALLSQATLKPAEDEPPEAWVSRTGPFARRCELRKREVTETCPGAPTPAGRDTGQ